MVSTPTPELACSFRLRHLPRNLVDAYLWYALAAREGVQEASQKAQELERQLSLSQLREARNKLSEPESQNGIPR